MAYQTQSREEKESVYRAIKENVRIINYASSIGLTPRRIGQKYYTLEEHDSVRIDPEKNCFWRNSGIGTNTAGSVIDFCMHFQGKNVHEALKELVPIAGIEEGNSQNQNASSYQSMSRKEQQETIPVQEGLHLPERGHDMRRVYAYLIKSRGLNTDIVQSFVDRKMLYQDVRNNCVFVAYDENKKPVFGNLRGTNTEKRFVGDLPGCDYQKGFYIDNQASKTIISEAVIDSMSVMSILKGKGEKIENYNYAVLSGADKQDMVFSHLDGVKELLVATDNDSAGRNAVRQLSNAGLDCAVTAYLPKNAKDWNQELHDVAKKFGRVSEIPFEPVGNALSAIRKSEYQEMALCSSRQMRSCPQLYEQNLQKREKMNQFLELSGEKENFRFEQAHRLAKDIALSDGSVKDEILFMKNTILDTIDIFQGDTKEIERRVQRIEHPPEDMEEELEAFSKVGDSIVRYDRFYMQENRAMAEIKYKGELGNVPLMVKNNQLFIATGEKSMGTLEQHFLGKMDQVHFKAFQSEYRKSYMEHACAREGEKCSELEPDGQMEL